MAWREIAQRWVRRTRFEQVQLKKKEEWRARSKHKALLAKAERSRGRCVGSGGTCPNALLASSYARWHESYTHSARGLGREIE